VTVITSDFAFAFTGHCSLLKLYIITYNKEIRKLLLNFSCCW